MNMLFNFELQSTFKLFRKFHQYENLQKKIHYYIPRFGLCLYDYNQFTFGSRKW